MEIPGIIRDISAVETGGVGAVYGPSAYTPMPARSQHLGNLSGPYALSLHGAHPRRVNRGRPAL